MLKPTQSNHKTEESVSAGAFWDSGAWIHEVIETAVDAIITINQAGLIQYMNPAALRLFGYTAEEALGQNVRLLMPAPHRQRHDEYLARYVQTGEARIIGIGREVFGRKKDGEIFPLFLSVSEVHVGGQRVFTGIIRNISEEKRAQEEQTRLLAELKERNKKITCLYSVGEAIRARQTEEEILNAVVALIRPACCRPEFTWVRITFDGRTYVGKGFRETPLAMSEHILVNGRKRGLVEVFVQGPTDDQEAEPYLQRDRDLIGSIARTLGEMHERRDAEAQVVQASKLASIGELASGVGHEINNPVNGIINCADILIQNLESGTKNHQFAELIRSEAERIATIVRDLLTFARRERTQHLPTRPADFVDTVLSLSKKRMMSAGIQLEVDVPHDLPEVLCRSERIQQVLMNLIINAIHALDEKYPEPHPNKRLRISAQVMNSRERPLLRLTVADRGSGIKLEHQERIFDPFFTTKGRDKGTGLGLSVSDEIVKEHGGAITVETTPGEGTAFHVDLPLQGD